MEQAGLTPLAPILATCDLAADDKTAAVAKLHAEYGVNVFFATGEGPDDKKSEWTLVQLHQSGLGLPDRDYYFDEDKAEKRALYEAHIASSLAMLGEEAEVAKVQAAAVMKLETKLAASHLTRSERRDPDTCYNKYSAAKLAALVKGAVEWPRYLELVGKPAPSAVNIDSPTALAVASRLLEATPTDELRAYLRWHVCKAYAQHLPKAFVDAHFEFFSKALSGQQEQKPRWKRAMAFVEDALGEAVGELYVEKYFGGEAKPRALATVENVRAALEHRLREVEWMAESTREKALQKMNEFNVKIGYPDEWVDYSKLRIAAGDHLGNVQRALAFEHARQMGYADAPTDRTRWLMLPQQINAYYHPNLNEIVFPAAILQPPFFDATADDAVNFGAMGAVVGHESTHDAARSSVAKRPDPFWPRSPIPFGHAARSLLATRPDHVWPRGPITFGPNRHPSLMCAPLATVTHGFDDQGRQYDFKGNLNDWWEKADGEEYERRVSVQVEQASRFAVYGKELNGKLTCGENIADLGGLKLAFAALNTQLDAKGSPGHINGFDAHQRFFLSWAQVWRENTTKERALQMVTLDPHGPNEYRVNGPLTNMPEFHAAFGVKEGDAMWRPQAERVDSTPPPPSNLGPAHPILQPVPAHPILLQVPAHPILQPVLTSPFDRFVVAVW